MAKTRTYKLTSQSKEVNSFDDLIFRYRPSVLSDDYCEFQAYYVFDNNYAISVITGKSKDNDDLFYTQFMHTYEVAIMFDGALCYDSGLTDDVLGYQTIDDINEIINKIKELPKREIPNE